MQSSTVIGIDLAKNIFEICGRDGEGHVVLRRRLRRSQMLRFFAQVPACLVGMETCNGSNYWARELSSLGHDTRLMPAQFVKAYVKTNKNDRIDAEAIAEAVTRPTMRFVRAKTKEQQAQLMVHRIRERRVRDRTALVNEMRSFLLEMGIAIPQGIKVLRRELPSALSDPRLPEAVRSWVEHLTEEWRALDERIAHLEARIKAQFRADDRAKRLTTIPGVGEMTATAILSSIGDPRDFKNGRQFAAWLGLVPRQHSTGGKTRLLGISKRGDRYLRKLLVHGGRAVVQFAARKTDPRSQWVTRLAERRGTNRAAIAVANRNARIIWSVLTSDQSYRVA